MCSRLALCLISVLPYLAWGEPLPLEWEAPTENVDGSPLTDLAGFQAYWGTSPRDYNVGTQYIADETATSTVLDVPPGDYYVAMTAWDSDGNQSAYSNEVFRTVAGTPQPVPGAATLAATAEWLPDSPDPPPSMAAPTYVGGDDNEGSSTSASVTHNQTINEGDLVVFGVHTNSSPTITLPAGFTSIADFVPTAETSRMALGYKTATGSEAASYTATLSVSREWNAFVKVFRGSGAAATWEIDAAALTATDTGGLGGDAVRVAWGGQSLSENSISIAFGGIDNRSTPNTYTGTPTESHVSPLCGSAAGSARQWTAAMHRIMAADLSVGGSGYDNYIELDSDVPGLDDVRYGIHVSLIETPTGPTSRADIGSSPSINTSNALGAKVLRAFPFVEGANSWNDAKQTGETVTSDGITINTGGGAQFSGTADDELIYTNDQGETFEVFNGNYTAFALFKYEGPTSQSDEHTLFSNSAAINTGDYALGFSDSTVEDGLEHSLAIAIDATGTSGKSYLDGVLKTTDTTGTSTPRRILARYDSSANAWEIWADDRTGREDLMVGGTWQKSTDRWDGTIELVLHFDETLTDQEVSDLHDNPWQVFNEDAGGAFTLDADTAAYALTGTTADLQADRILEADTDSYALSGTDAALQYGRQLAADPGSYTLTGTDAALIAQRILEADSGGYVLTGTDAALDFGGVGAFELAADSGSYVLTGTAAALQAQRLLEAASGVYALTGEEVELTYTPSGAFVLTADSGTYVLSGTDADLLRDLILNVDPGTYLYTGSDATLGTGIQIAAEPGTYSVNGSDVSFSRTYVLNTEVGTYVLTGRSVTLLASGVPAIGKAVSVVSSTDARSIAKTGSRSITKEG